MTEPVNDQSPLLWPHIRCQAISSQRSFSAM